MLKLVIADQSYVINLKNNQTVQNFVKRLPIQINYRPFSNLEIYGSVGELDYDKSATSKKAIAGQLKYCLEYHSLVLVCQNHHDIFNEVDLGTVEISSCKLQQLANTSGSFTIKLG